MNAMQMQEYWNSQRFDGIRRLYGPTQVVEQQGTIRQEYPVAADSAVAMYELLRRHFEAGTSVTTFGPYSPGQAVSMKRKGIDAIYLGGWATSAKGSVTEDPGADLAAYPLSQVPDEAAPIVRALLTADRNQKFARARMTDEQLAATTETDFRPFIIADADTGHGGDAHVRNLIRRFVEVGVPGYHIEDQRPGTKKCGHQGGKVLVSVDEQIKRLNAARFQLDIMEVPGIIVARTDAEAATLLDNNSDPRDHAFILGTTNVSIPAYALCTAALMRYVNQKGEIALNGYQLFGFSDDELEQVEKWLRNRNIFTEVDALFHSFADQRESLSPGLNQAPIEDALADAAQNILVKTWEAEARLKTYAEAVADLIRSRDDDCLHCGMEADDWLDFATGASIDSARKKARELGMDCYWDMEKARTAEGYYQVRGGIGYAIRKSLEVAPYADIIWMETKTANLEEARQFAQAIHAVYPDKMLAYNLSPSFNWDTTGMSDDEMRNFPAEIGKLGFVFNFITYGGHQIDGLASEDFSTALLNDGMLALARLQRKFRLLDSPYTTPQSLVGGPRLDAALAASSGRTATTKAMGKGSTQFQHLVQTELPIGTLNTWLQAWQEAYSGEILSSNVENAHNIVSISARLIPVTAGEDILELQVSNTTNGLIANIVFTTMEDRLGRTMLFVRDQNTFIELYRKKRLMTLMQLFLYRRYRISRVQFMTPSEDNRSQCEAMHRRGIFTGVREEIGDVIVADVNLMYPALQDDASQEVIAELLPVVGV